jgi:glycosyltransferase involved in cell wall biosynthesis
MEKTKTIVSVGRFSAYRQAKKQEIMIDSFRTGWQNSLKGWNLVFAGSRHPQDQAYFESLVRRAAGLPVDFYPDCKMEQLKDIYGRAGIYWHAAGYGEIDPAAMEHFGISTVESMSAGCIPVVYGGGGQTEIIDDGINGYLWKTPDDLLEITGNLVSNRVLMEKIRKNAIRRSMDFSAEKFTDAFDRILESL